MNRNNERHFLQIPEMHASRTRFKRDQTILTTFDSGKLIPFFVDEVLPGDTFQVDTAAIIRMSTPKYPVMDDAFIDFYYFYTPNRILWDKFKHFMGEVEETPWMPTIAYKVPQIKINGTTEKPAPNEKSILDYMGVPTKITKPFTVNALPIRAYVKIWNEFFRDENVDNAAVLKSDSADVTYKFDEEATETLEKDLQNAVLGGNLLPVNKYHDYFTSCLPYPQRGPEVNLPMSGNAPIYWADSTDNPLVIADLKNTGIWKEGTGGYLYRTGNEIMTQDYKNVNEKARAILGTFTGSTKLGERMTADLSAVTAATINDLRQAVS